MLYHVSMVLYIKKSVNTGCREATPSLLWDYKRDKPESHSNQPDTETARNPLIHTHAHRLAHISIDVLQYRGLQTHTEGLPLWNHSYNCLYHFLPLACKHTQATAVNMLLPRALTLFILWGKLFLFYFIQKNCDLYPNTAFPKPLVLYQVWVSGKLLLNKGKSLWICIILCHFEIFFTFLLDIVWGLYIIS